MTETTTALTIRADQQGFTDQQIAALRQAGMTVTNPADVAVFFHQAKRSGLDPFLGEIYLVPRKGGPTIQTGIKGLQKIADRVTQQTGGTYGIDETLWCGDDGVWHDVWIPEATPTAAKAVVTRNGARFTAVVLFREYNAGTPIWKQKPSFMLGKCAEAAALRKAFPDQMGGLYVQEEMGLADMENVTPAAQSEPTQVNIDESIREAWNDPDRLQALGKCGNRAGWPRETLQSIYDRWQQLLAQQQQETADDETIAEGGQA